MNCVGEQCGFWQEHLFNQSYVTCNLSMNSFKKDTIIFCPIKRKIKEQEEILLHLKILMLNIKANQ